MSDVLPWILFVLCAALLVAALWGWWRATTRVRRNNLARQVVASAGEADAAGLLEQAGFEVLDRQVTAWWTLLVDGEPHEVSSRADWLVTRDGFRYVAEVKTGARATDPCNPATRRQLLEYGLAFRVEGVLLVDMEAHRVHQVEFPSTKLASRTSARDPPKVSLS